MNPMSQTLKPQTHWRVGAAVLFAWLYSSSPLTAQVQIRPIPEIKPFRLESRSQQFHVIGYPAGTELGPPSASHLLTNHVQMEPMVLVLTAERVRTELLSEIGFGDGWQGRITIHVQGELPPATPVLVESQHYSNGWRYRVVLPGQLDRPRLVRALSRALLLEFANRNNPTSRLAEIPLWLEEGLGTHLLAVHGDTLVPEVRSRIELTRSAAPDAFVEARLRLRGHNLTPFAELVSAQPGQFGDTEWETFRRTAQLLVAELLNLPEGRAALTEFLRQLPNYLNSQLAFLHAFGGRFPTMLDAEKWWAVVWTHFTAQDRHMRFSLAHSLGQLDEVLVPPISVRLEASSVPGRKALPLREVIAHTDFGRHQPAVLRASVQLQLLQVAAPLELARLIGDYRNALQQYLNRRGSPDARSTTASADAKLATKDVLERLDLLDVIRADFRRLDAAAPSTLPCPTGPE